jgi:acetolactate synthase-1/2/3 large subunit
MNGAESLVRTLTSCGIDTCFANPGTSEMHFVAALDRVAGIRCILGLAEGVVTGAADGYARIAERPAITLMHCGPGLANGLANLHNARRARSAIVNIVGDQATYHRPLDAPLTADTEGWARPVSAWMHSATRPEEVGGAAAKAVQIARTSPGQIATLILPSDVSWNEGGVVAEVLSVAPMPEVAPNVVTAMAGILRSRERAIIVLGGTALRAEALIDAYSIAKACDVQVVAESYNARIERGRGRVPIERVPFAVDQALVLFKDVKHVILIGANEPVALFAYPGKPNRLLPDDAAVHVLAESHQNLPAALAKLREAVGVARLPIERDRGPVPHAALGPTGGVALAQSLTALLPEHAIVVEEGISAGRPLYAGTVRAPPHDWLQITGGAIGSGLPMALGASIAAPHRRVVSLQADGSAMYTVQALWTQAREHLNITTVILANRKYAILLHELAAVGATAGRTALDMLDIGRPDLDWVGLAQSMGVPGARAATMEGFNDLFKQANSRSGPFLIELVLE